MNLPKCSLELYSEFLIANHNRYSALELEKVAALHHDAVTRWLSERKFDSKEIWNQAKQFVDKATGYLVGDDTLLDKRYSKINELAKVQYSGNEHGLVNGIALVNLLWANDERMVPVDYRIYWKDADDKTKNDHFRDMLDEAKTRAFSPLYVLIDAWYGSAKNLKDIRGKDWHFICNVRCNRKVCEQQGFYVPIQDLNLTDKQVRKVWLKEYGYVLVCKLVATNGDITYLATDDLSLTDYDTLTGHWSYRWKIEEFHRGIKQTTGIEKCQAVKGQSQKTHIFAAFTAFLKLEAKRIKEHVSWYEQKASISRVSTLNYLNYSSA